MQTLVLIKKNSKSFKSKESKASLKVVWYHKRTLILYSISLWVHSGSGSLLFSLLSNKLSKHWSHLTQKPTDLVCCNFWAIQAWFYSLLKTMIPYYKLWRNLSQLKPLLGIHCLNSAFKMKSIWMSPSLKLKTFSTTSQSQWVQMEFFRINLVLRDFLRFSSPLWRMSMQCSTSTSILQATWTKVASLKIQMRQSLIIWLMPTWWILNPLDFSEDRHIKSFTLLLSSTTQQHRWLRFQEC